MTAIIDIETDSENVYEANLKFFGALDFETGEVTIFDYTQKTKIRSYLRNHKILIGYNIKNFDIPILKDYGISLYGHQIVDLWECLAPRGEEDYGKYNKNRLHDINPALSPKDYKLKTIIETLNLDDKGKGELDYTILKKNIWTAEEKGIIFEYLTQDLIIESKLFEWYSNIFKPLEDYLPLEIVEDYKHLTCTSGSLAYKVICHMANISEEYEDSKISYAIKMQSPRIEGGHHIHPRWEKITGRIIPMDFVSHYPTIMIMYDLVKKEIVESLSKLLKERIDAKIKKDKTKSTALKIPINSVYGILGNPTFRSIYNPNAAAECTRLGRELLKRYAMTLDISGFIPLYGFTDSVYVGIPKGLSETELDDITNYYLDEIRKEAKIRVESFGLSKDQKIKFMWFIEKKDNNYLYVTEDNKIHIKGGLFDKNTPNSITELFEEYISPKIIKEMDINFTENELLSELLKLFDKNPELAAEEYKVKNKNLYKIETSLQYQISSRYGPGKHLLIPNNADIGVGRSKEIKYCTYEEFKENDLTADNIHIQRMLKYIIPFCTTKEKVFDLDKEQSQ